MFKSRVCFLISYVASMLHLRVSCFNKSDKNASNFYPRWKYSSGVSSLFAFHWKSIDECQAEVQCLFFAISLIRFFCEFISQYRDLHCKRTISKKLSLLTNYHIDTSSNEFRWKAHEYRLQIFTGNTIFQTFCFTVAISLRPSDSWVLDDEAFSFFNPWRKPVRYRPRRTAWRRWWQFHFFFQVRYAANASVKIRLDFHPSTPAPFHSKGEGRSRRERVKRKAFSLSA